MTYTSLLKTGANLARAATKLAALSIFPTDERKQRVRAAVADLLGGQRGLSTKIGQLLAGEQRDDNPFYNTCVNAKPLPSETLLPVLETALGQPLDAVFATFGECVHAASIGQVHRARLRDGTDVAVKIRYPGIAESVDAELTLLGLMPGVGPVKTWGIDLDGYKSELSAALRKELDYTHEAVAQRAFSDNNYRQNPYIIPAVIEELSNEAVLTQRYEAGVDVNDVVDLWSQEQRNAAGTIILQNFFHQLFNTGQLHTDPNPGNYGFRRNLRGQVEVVLYDYGCTMTLARNRSLALLRLILGARQKDSTAPLAAFALAGFDARKLSYIDARLPALCERLFEPFLHDRVYPLEDWHAAEDASALLGEDRWWFRSAGPTDLLLLVRAFQGTVMLLKRLDARLHWPALLQTTCAEAIDAARSLALPAVSGPDHHTFADQASSLRIRVHEQGVEKVALQMPTRSVDMLHELVPTEVLTNLSQQGIAIHEIMSSCKRSGYAPGPLFELDTGHKNIRVWLE